MRKIFIDTGAWFALKNKNDPYHSAVVDFFKSITHEGIVCYTSDYIIDEAITLTRARLNSPQASLTLAEELLSEKAAIIVYAAPHYLSRALEIYRKYIDKNFSFTDCTSFAIMEDLKIEEVLAFDGHFSFEAFGFR